MKEKTNIDTAALRAAIDGVGTSEATVFEMLRSCSSGEIADLESAYNEHYENRHATNALQLDLEAAMDDDELAIARAYLTQRRGIAIRLELSRDGDNDQGQRIEAILKNCHDAELVALRASARTTIEHLRKELVGCDLDVLEVLLDPKLGHADRQIKVGAIRICDSLYGGIGTDEGKIKQVLEATTDPVLRTKLRAYFESYVSGVAALDLLVKVGHEGSDLLGSALLRELDRGADRIGASPAEIFDALDDANYFIEWEKGSPTERAALQERRIDELDKALDYVGGVQDLINRAMDEAPAHYDELLTERNPALVNRCKNATLGWMVAQRKLQTGQAEPELLLAYACWGAPGVDVDLITQALSDNGKPKSVADIKALIARFEGIWGTQLIETHEFDGLTDSNLRNRIATINAIVPAGVMSTVVDGTDWNAIRVLLCGKPVTLNQLKYLGQLRMKHATSMFKRAWTSGLLGEIGRAIATGDSLTKCWMQLEASNNRLNTALDQAKHTGHITIGDLGEAGGGRLERYAEYLAEDVRAYRMIVTSLVDTIVTVRDRVTAVEPVTVGDATTLNTEPQRFTEQAIARWVNQLSGLTSDADRG